MLKCITLFHLIFLIRSHQSALTGNDPILLPNNYIEKSTASYVATDPSTDSRLIDYFEKVYLSSKSDYNDMPESNDLILDQGINDGTESENNGDDADLMQVAFQGSASAAIEWLLARATLMMMIINGSAVISLTVFVVCKLILFLIK